MGKVKAAAMAGAFSAEEPNPRAVIGGNNPPAPVPAVVVELLTAQYSDVIGQTAAALAAAQLLPKEVTSDEESGTLAAAVKEMREIATKAEAYRVKEKDPYFRTAQQIDVLFNGLGDRLSKGEQILTKRVHAFNLRKLEEERLRRLEEQRVAAAAADAARAKLRAEQEAAATAQRLAEEAQAAAERARKAENIAAHEERAEQHQAQAEQHQEVATERRVDALMAQDRLQDANIAAAAKSADIVRTRHDSGAMTTMKQVGYVEITDVTLLNKELIWPHLKEDHIHQALKALAKTRKFKMAMDGAVIEMRDDTAIL